MMWGLKDPTYNPKEPKPGRPLLIVLACVVALTGIAVLCAAYWFMKS